MSEMGMFNHVPKPDEVAAKAFSMSRDEQEQWSWPSYCCGLSDGGVCDARVTEIMFAAMNGEFSHNIEQAFSGEPSPMHDHIEQLEAENAKLREQVLQLQLDWESERDYADQMEAKEKLAVAENNKLRELFYEAWGWMQRARHDRSIRASEMDEIGTKAVELGFPDYELGIEVK